MKYLQISNTMPGVYFKPQSRREGQYIKDGACARELTVWDDTVIFTFVFVWNVHNQKLKKNKQAGNSPIFCLGCLKLTTGILMNCNKLWNTIFKVPFVLEAKLIVSMEISLWNSWKSAYLGAGMPLPVVVILIKLFRSNSKNNLKCFSKTT